ncbi:MAG: hypothetical protein HY904_08905 [Deltaproteobacteria bacterium]|nr:hypothetical protein [Deltaproteobacteria bacterium]
MTYLKNDPEGPGFFIQSQTAGGPALYVHVDPASLTPSPAVGNVVSMTITDMGTTGGQRRALAVSGVVVNSTGFNVGSLVQDATAVDLVAQLDAHESELVTVSGSIASAQGTAGTGFRAYQITTTGVAAPSNAFRLRMPDTVGSALGTIAAGCSFTATATPLWRFNTDAQVQVWQTSELSITNCPSAGAARLAVNEFNTNIANGCDIIELRVVTGGDLSGYTVQAGGPTAPVLTFPSFNVAKNDFILVHTGTGTNMVSCGGAASGTVVPTNETTAKTDVPPATAPANSDSAWDFWTGAGGLTNTTNIVLVADNLGAVQDAVAWWDGAATSVNSTTTGLMAIANGGTTPQWVDVNGNAAVTSPVASYTDAAVSGAAGNTRTGDSAQRPSDADTNRKADWGVAAPTWGALNAGQSILP